jgi:hypothetical protein
MFFIVAEIQTRYLIRQPQSVTNKLLGVKYNRRDKQLYFPRYEILTASTLKKEAACLSETLKASSKLHTTIY